MILVFKQLLLMAKKTSAYDNALAQAIDLHYIIAGVEIDYSGAGVSIKLFHYLSGESINDHLSGFSTAVDDLQLMTVDFQLHGLRCGFVDERLRHSV